MRQARAVNMFHVAAAPRCTPRGGGWRSACLSDACRGVMQEPAAAVGCHVDLVAAGATVRFL